MRKHTFLFIIFLYVGICIQVKATDQRGEYLVIGKIHWKCLLDHWEIVRL